MSLSEIISKTLAGKLAELTIDDFKALAGAGSVGLTPERLYNGVQALAGGEEYDLPNVGGGAKALHIQAYSFLKDRGQYGDTYGISSAHAGELLDLLLTDKAAAIKEITGIVSDALRKRGSPKPVVVNDVGMPGVAAEGVSTPGAGKAARSALKAEITRSPALYGMYKFDAAESGGIGALRYRVSLGGGLYTVNASKVGAVDAARICRVHGRGYALIADCVCFWLEGRPPVFGKDIPPKVEFDGKLPPHGEPPPNPVAKAKTAAPPPMSPSRVEGD